MIEKHKLLGKNQDFSTSARGLGTPIVHCYDGKRPSAIPLTLTMHQPRPARGKEALAVDGKPKGQEPVRVHGACHTRTKGGGLAYGADVACRHPDANAADPLGKEPESRARCSIGLRKNSANRQSVRIR